MTPEENKQHWKSWVDQHGSDVKATTMSQTAKTLEIDALWRHLKDMSAGTRVLEAGCGNGINCIELAKRFPWFTFEGFDYVPEMVQTAKQANKEDNAIFSVGNVLTLDKNRMIGFDYDVVITDRCLINLPSWEHQQQGINALAGKLRPGGTLLMIENVLRYREYQNDMREILGLPRRQPAPFNLFLDIDQTLDALAENGLILDEIEHFSALHDLMLYVLVPALDGGPIDYDHPLVKVATELSLGGQFPMGPYGQNCLFVCRKPA